MTIVLHVVHVTKLLNIFCLFLCSLTEKFSDEYENAGRPEKKKGLESRNTEYGQFLANINKSIELPRSQVGLTESTFRQYYQPLIKVCNGLTHLSLNSLKSLKSDKSVKKRE